METSMEAGREGTIHSFGWSNFSLLELTKLNGTFRGGLYFWMASQNSTVNPTQAPGPVRVRDAALARVEIGILGLVLALTTLGNSFVLWVLLRRRKYNAPMHLFMVNLCVADLVVAFFQVLPQLVWDITERFQGPDVLCRSVKYLQIVGMFASSYMIVAMTVDRHNAICCPLQAYKGKASSRWNTPIMVAWALALVLSVPQVFIFSRSEVSPGVFECWGTFAEAWGLKAYVTWMTIAVFVLPTFIITVCQVRIFREIHDNIYLKSERVVSADMKKNLVVFHFPLFKRQASAVRGQDRCSEEELRKNNRGGDLSPHNSAAAEEPGCQDICTKSLTWQTHTFSSCPDVLPHLQTLQTTWSNSDSVQNSYGYSVTHPASNNMTENTHTASPSCSGPPPIRGVSKAMSKTLKMTLVIVLVYTVCWSPFFVVQLWAAWDPNPPDQGVAFTILMLLASLNSCTNPWIYTAFSSSVSTELVSLLRCRPRLPRRTSLYDHSSDIYTSTTKDNHF